MAFVSGFKRQATKLPFFMGKPSSMSDAEEFWPVVVLGSTIPSWPSSQYPALMFTSSDHSASSGGIFLRVYEAALGSIESTSSWLEWQVVSGRAEFNHITKKTNPIYVDSTNGFQTETPWVTVDGGVVSLHYHNASVNAGYDNLVQNTCYATGNNGVDFTRQGICLTYNPQYSVGNGHTGYLRFGTHNFSNVPYTYIGKATHGGGKPSNGSTQQIVVSNDKITWETIHLWGLAAGRAGDYFPTSPAGIDWMYVLDDIHNAKKEGAYWRINASVRPEVATGGIDDYNRPIELLVDDEFRIVSAPNEYLSLGASGDLDELQILRPFEFLYQGTVYCFYKGWDGTDSTIMLASIADVQGDWEVFTNFSSTTVLDTYKSDDGINPSTGLTFSQAPLVDGLGRTVIQASLEFVHSSAESNNTYDLSSHDVFDIVFDGIGKATGGELRILSGIANADYATTSLSDFIVLDWPKLTTSDALARSEPIKMFSRSNVGGDSIISSDDKYIGHSRASWHSNNQDESSDAKMIIGLRIIPSLNIAILLNGQSEQDVLDITGFDYTKPMIAFVRVTSTNETNVKQFMIDKIDIKSHSLSAPAVPLSTTATLEGAANSFSYTLTSVAGATGYKLYYGQNGVYDEVDSGLALTGSISALTTGESYDVYSRAYNALGDSEPTTTQSVTATETATSTANITITGIPNGDHYIYLNDDTHTEIHSGLVTFAAEAATLPALTLAVGARYYGYWTGSNAPTDGSGITGVTI
jgi:hypothetical protein